MAAMGFSLGANILLKYLGEAGAAAPLMAACAVSAPADLAAASRALSRPRNLLYHRALLRDFKRHAARPGARLDTAERAAIQGAGTIYQLDDRFVAPRHGFAGAADYYDRCRAGRYLAAIEVPTLILHAENDPIVPPAPEYRQPERLAPAVTVALSRSGGHVGFHGRQGVWYLDRFTRMLDGLA